MAPRLGRGLLRAVVGCDASGLTDESIARELDVSVRTAQLGQVLGATTRFQLGLQAARRGWL